jgi:multidrug efflux system membrane fusion protein
VLARLKSGDKMPVVALDRDGRTRLATGRLSTTDNTIDSTTGTIKLKAVFDNRDGALFPNQFVNVRLLLDTLQDATVVPTSAIQRGAPGTYVYVVKDDATVTVRTVKLGPTDGELTSIAEGLAVGERVVSDGADKLREGAKVEVIDANAPAGGRQRGPGQAPGKGGGKGEGKGAGGVPPTTPAAGGAPAKAPQ